MDRRNIKNIYPLTPLQEGMLFHALREEGATTYFEQLSLKISGALDLRLFAESWRELVRRHDILRTLFVHEKVPEPLQIVLKERPFETEYVDLRPLSPAARETRAEEERRADRARPFRLDRDPLLRVRVLQRGETAFEVLWSFHHILLDGWSTGILRDELFTIYRALQRGERPHLPEPPPFARYVKYLRARDREESLHYWSALLAGYGTRARLPGRREKEAGAPFRAGFVDFTLAEAATRTLADRARAQRTTLSTVVQAAWGALLARYNALAGGPADVVFLATVSGRPADLPGVEKMVGLFINAVPVRVAPAPETRFADLIESTHRQSLEGQPHHFASLADIQARTPLRQELADHIVVFENHTQEEAPDAAGCGFTIDAAEAFDHTNFPLTIQVHPGARLGFHCIFDATVFDRAVVETFGAHLRQVLDQVAIDPGRAVDAADLFNPADLPFPTEEAKLELLVAATFTAEPLEPYLRLWAAGTKFPLAPAFAPYNQIFRQLLDPASEMAGNGGANLLLVRFEDWLRDLDADRADCLRTLEENFSRLLGGLKNWRGRGLLLVGLLPPPPATGRPPEVASRLRELGERLRAVLPPRGRVRLLDLTGLPRLHALGDILDSEADRAGHVPYTETFYAAMAGGIVRELHAWKTPGFKVIAVDGDNTLWGGVCGEEGPAGVRIAGGYAALQRFLRQKRAEGFLLVLCSKNNEADVWEVFRQPGMILRREHFVAHRIDWAPKSANLRQLAQELNLGLDSFIFIDDSGAECAEVMCHAPEVLTLQLPADDGAIPRWLELCWAFDRFTVTDEDRARSGMYRAEQERGKTLARVGLDDFLASLGLQVAMVPLRAATASEDLVERLAQLTLRTNQFNLNGRRRSREDIEARLADPGHVLWAVEVADRFGRYGIVGLIAGRPDAGVLRIDSLLLSCRVLGREVEFALLAGLGRYCREKGLTGIVLHHRETARNHPFREFLQRAGAKAAPPAGVGELPHRFATGDLPALPAHIDGRFDGGFLPPAPERKTPEAAVPATVVAPPPPAAAVAAGGWSVHLANEENLLHRVHYFPLVHCNPETLPVPPPENKPRAAGRPVVPLRTPLEEAIAGIWREVLSLAEVGAEDNFFELGGHSLKATRLVSRLHARLGSVLALDEVFSHPTVARQAALLAGRLPAAVATATAATADDYPLTHMQRRLWVLQQMAPDSPFYSTPACYRIDGRLDADLLRRAFAAVAQRHETLRTVFAERDGEPRQRIIADFPPEFRLLDLRDAADPLDAARRLAWREIGRPFDLAAGPPCRALLLRVAAERHVLVWNLHHIVSDGWSMRILAEEVLTLYRGWSEGRTAELKPLTLRYRDFAVQQQSRPQTTAHRDYWRGKLAGAALLDFPADRPRPPVPSWRGGAHTVALPAAALGPLRRLATQADAGLFPVLVALVKILLLRGAGQQDIVVGAPVSGRHHPGLEPLVGLFVNTVALRDTIRPDDAFAAVVRTVRTTVTEAMAHQDYPFDRLVEDLGVRREMSRSPLFDVMVVLQDEDEVQETGGLIIAPLEGVAPGASRFDMTFNFFAVGDELHLELVWASDLYDAARMHRLLACFCELCRSAAADPAATAGSLNLLPAGERRVLLERFAAPRRTPAPHKTLIDLFEARVRENPDRTALLWRGEALTYGELDVRAGRVAALLTGTIGLRPEEPVAVVGRRAPASIAALLGILRAGGAWLPIDPALPAERIRYMLAQSGCRLLLAEEGLAPGELADTTVLPLDPPPELPSVGGVLAAPSSLAYILFTSGSTGRPKGVMVEHGGFVNMVLDQIALFAVAPEDRVLQFASISFDASLSEIFMALLSGAALVLPEEATLRDPAAFAALLQQTGVSVLTLPPSYLNALDAEALAGVKTLITAGEPAIPADALRYAGRLRYYNAYGPTETSVCATVHHCTPPQGPAPAAIPIGVPVANLAVHLLDAHLQPVPIGFPGEICIAGPGVARGYVNAPQLTAERFVPDPFQPERKMYRTGDLGRRLENGEIVFLGRRDTQLKIRGYRIEPGEIEAALAAHPRLRQSCVFPVRRDGGTILAAAVITDGLDTDALRAFLRGSLPEYMIPTAFLAVTQLPTTVNGKIDCDALVRRLLAATPATGNRREPPASENERILLDIWRRVLDREDIGRRDNFFDLGGDSIRAIQSISALRARGLALAARDLFLHPVPADLAPRLQPATDTPRSAGEPCGVVPLAPAQAWYFARFVADAERVGRLDPAPNAVLLHLAGELSGAGLRQLLTALIGRHHALRATFRWGREGEERIVQEIAAVPGDSEPLIVDLRRTADAEARLAAHGREILESLHPFAPAPLRAALFRHDDGDRLLLAVQHLVVDGVSWRILLDDLAAGLRRLAAGEAVELPPATTPFRTWTTNLRAVATTPALLATIPHWQQTLARCAPPGVAPTEVPLTQRRRLETTLPCPAEGGVGLPLLLSALHGSLQRLTGAAAVPVMLEGHGRDPELVEGDYDRTVGWFTAFYPAVLTGGTEDAVPAARGAGYGVLRHLTPAVLRGDFPECEPAIGFNWLGHFATDPWTDVFSIQPVPGDGATLAGGRMVRDLQITASRTETSLHVVWEYNQRRFGEKQIAAAAGDFRSRLDAMLQRGGNNHEGLREEH